MADSRIHNPKLTLKFALPPVKIAIVICRLYSGLLVEQRFRSPRLVECGAIRRLFWQSIAEHAALVRNRKKFFVTFGGTL